MTDTLNGVKAKAMSATLGETGSVNGLEKKYWEHILAGGGAGGGGSDPALAAKVDANTNSITSLTTEVGTKISQQDADNRYLTATGDNTHHGDLFVMGELGAQSLILDAPAEVGMFLSTDGNDKYFLQPMAIGGTPIANGKLEYNYTTSKWSANGGELASTNGPTFIADTIVRGELAADSVAVQPDNSYGMIIRGDGVNSFIIPTDKLGKVKGNVLHYNHTEGKWAANGGALIPEAPKDGNTYARNNGAWVQVMQTRHVAPPEPSWNPDNVNITGGFSDDINDEVHISTNKVGSPITIQKVDDTAMHAVILLDPVAASHVAGITIDGGLPAQWDSHAVTWKDGTQHVAFMSPYKFTKQSLEIGINWK